VDFYEFVSEQVFSVNGYHVEVADSNRSSVRGLDFLVRGARGDAENIVKRRARGVGVQIRRSPLLHLGRASFSDSDGDGECDYRPGFDAAQ